MNKTILSVILGLIYIVGCSAQLLPVIDSCIICSSQTNITCSTNPDSHQRLPCAGTAFGLGCYTRIVGPHTLRGCASELDEAVLSDCQNERCNRCPAATISPPQPIFGCNNEVFPEHRRRCHVCSGPVNDTCDGMPIELPTVCEMYDPLDRCYIQRTATVVTRGCMSGRGTNCENPNHCFICEANGCNNIFGDSPSVPVAPGSSASTNNISIIMLTTAFYFALAKFI